jgi:hypothetical protein
MKTAASCRMDADCRIDDIGDRQRCFQNVEVPVGQRVERASIERDAFGHGVPSIGPGGQRQFAWRMTFDDCRMSFLSATPGF